MTEEWRQVVGWEGLYEISNRGRVKSLDRWIPQQNRTFPGRIMKPGSDGRYLYVILRKNGVSVNRRVHVMVLEAFAGPCPPGMEALHGRSGSLDNRWPESGLHWGTHVENMQDKVRDGTAWWIYEKWNPVTRRRELR